MAAVVDPLLDLLNSVRLTGGVFLEARFRAPWCVTSRITDADLAAFMAAPANVIGYHFVLDGRLLLAVEGHEHLEVGAGKIVLFPRNDFHMLASAPGLKPVNADDLIMMAPDGGLAQIDHGGDGETTHVVCGFLGMDDLLNPLIAALPKVMTLDVREVASHDWIEASVRFAARQLASGSLATSSLMSRLSELLFVAAVREYAATLGKEDWAWLRGISDPHIARALGLIHQDAARAWSVDILAREVGLSRSGFVERFTSLVGMPPIRYVTARRLQAARLQLRETRRTVGQVAFAVGYGSEEAFSRAYKREFGRSPAYGRNRIDGGALKPALLAPPPPL